MKTAEINFAKLYVSFLDDSRRLPKTETTYQICVRQFHFSLRFDTRLDDY